MNSQDVLLTKEELLRYSRHILLPEFGITAQNKLKAARVLVIGAGGLGSPVLLYLAAAGVGALGIVDYDVVEDSNLHRQVLFGVDQLGEPKVEAAKQRLQHLNPHITVTIYKEQLTSKNALDIIKGYDLVADGSDNFPTRYLVNDACVLLDKPCVFASVFQFEGHVTVFNYSNPQGERGPNYRDLFATPPPAGLVPGCAEGGVLGVLPGIIGCMQALEVIKVISGVGEILNGRLYLFDALTFESRLLNIQRSPSNPLNGKTPTITQLVNYEEFCGVPAVQKSIREITSKEFIDLQIAGADYQLIDVREAAEHEAFNIDGTLIPLATLIDSVDLISRDRMVIMHCKSGARSASAIRLLESQFGFNNLFNLKGGILGYSEQAQPPFANY